MAFVIIIIIDIICGAAGGGAGFGGRGCTTANCAMKTGKAEERRFKKQQNGKFIYTCILLKTMLHVVIFMWVSLHHNAAVFIPVTNQKLMHRVWS